MFTSAGVAPDTVMVSFPLRAVVAVFPAAVTVMVALPVPEVRDMLAHDGAPVIVHAPLVVMVNVFASPVAAKTSDVGDTLNVGVGAPAAA